MDKETETPNEIDLLGARIAVSTGFVEATLPPHRRESLMSGLKQMMSDNVFSPANAAKWRGRLGFAQSLMFGRMGRALLQPFSARQYAKLSTTNWKLSDDLREVIPWWVANIDHSIPRRANAIDSHPVLAYTDASGEGHIGCVIYIDGKRTMGHTHLPQWFRDLLPGIFEYEICANIFGLAMAAELAPGRPVLLCCDNQGAKGAVIRGSCRTKLGRILVSAFWAMAAAFATSVWVEYVRSKVNCSGPASRCCAKLPLELRAVVSEPNEGAPRLSTHMFSSKRELYAAHYLCSSSHRGRASPWPCHHGVIQNPALFTGGSTPRQHHSNGDTCQLIQTIVVCAQCVSDIRTSIFQTIGIGIPPPPPLPFPFLRPLITISSH